jgi:hypothetical protein
MTIDSTTLQLICNAAAETAVERFCKKNGIKTKDEISQRAAFRGYGEGRIKRWEKAGKLHPIKTGTGNSKIRYSRSEIDMIIRIESIVKNSLTSI